MSNHGLLDGLEGGHKNHDVITVRVINILKKAPNVDLVVSKVSYVHSFENQEKFHEWLAANGPVTMELNKSLDHLPTVTLIRYLFPFPMHPTKVIAMKAMHYV